MNSTESIACTKSNFLSLLALNIQKIIIHNWHAPRKWLLLCAQSNCQMSWKYYDIQPLCFFSMINERGVNVSLTKYHFSIAAGIYLFWGQRKQWLPQQNERATKVVTGGRCGSTSCSVIERFTSGHHVSYQQPLLCTSGACCGIFRWQSYLTVS